MRRIMFVARTSISRLVLSIPLLLILVPAWGQDKPPFEVTFDPYSSPGTSLTIDLVSVLNEPPNGIAVVSIKQTGFTDSGSNLVVWHANFPGYNRFRPVLGEGGSVMLGGVVQYTDTIAPTDITSLVVGGYNSSFRKYMKTFPSGNEGIVLVGYIRGQYFNIVLADEDAGTRAQAGFAPFPIEAKGNGSCGASAQVLGPFASMFYVRFSGFEVGEKVTTRRVFKEEVVTEEGIIPDRDELSQEIEMMIQYPKKSRGQARVTAEGSGGCSVSLSFSVGKSALKAE